MGAAKAPPIAPGTQVMATNSANHVLSGRHQCQQMFLCCGELPGGLLEGQKEGRDFHITFPMAGTGFRASHLLGRRLLYHLSSTSSPSCSGYFGDRV
jgi:hypothetical protein